MKLRALFLNSWASGIVGVSVALLGAQVVPPAVSILAGTLASVIIMRNVDGRRRYAWAGTVFSLGAGVTFATALVPASYHRTPMVALIGFGLFSLVIVGLREVGRVVVVKTAGKVGDGEYAGTVWSAVSAIGGLISMIWAVISAEERAARTGGIGIAGTISFALGLWNVNVPIPLWFFDSGLDATTVVFVGSVVAGFHTLGSWHHAWQASKMTAKRSGAAGRIAASKSRHVTNSATGSALSTVRSIADSLRNFSSSKKD